MMALQRKSGDFYRSFYNSSEGGHEHFIAMYPIVFLRHFVKAKKVNFMVVLEEKLEDHQSH